MKQNLLILAAGLLAGAAGVFIFINTTNSSRMVVTPEDSDLPAEEAAALPQAEIIHPETAPRPPVPAIPAVTTPAAPAPPSAWAKLAQKYGPEKTALSSKVTSNLTSVINTGMDLARTAARNSGSSNLTEAATRELLRGATRELALTEDQQREAGVIIGRAVDRRLGAVDDLVGAMSHEPEQIMELLLAGDALARQQITQAEYDGITESTRSMLRQMGSFIGGRPGTDGLVDPEVAAQLNAILTPDQQVKFTELTAKMAERAQARQAAQARSGMPFQLGEIPVMELDRVDQSVTSIQQMADAARQMMEAMKNLKEANPNAVGR